MNKNLILLTNRFPYYNGETFLETELEFLSEKFENIYIFSFSKKNNQRFINKNVKAFPLNINGNLFFKLKIFLIFPFRKLLQKDFKPRNKKEIFSFLISNFACRKILKILNREKISDIDLIYSYWCNLICTTGILLKRKLKCKNITRAHGGDLYSDRFVDGIVPCQEYNIQKSDTICVISKNGLEYLASRFPLYKEKFVLSRLGVSCAGINPPKVSKQHVLVTCSNIIRVKRLDLLAGALKFLKEKIDFHWYCLGDGNELEFLKKIVCQYKLNDDVTFLGRLSNTEVKKFYSNNHIDLFLNVSSSEGVPVSVMEALSFGIPCICTDVGGTREILSSNCGKLLDKDITENELSNCIFQWLTKQKKNCKNDCINQWKKECDASILYKNWVDFLGDF